MRYRRFTIRNYRAITGPLIVDVGKDHLLPVIGVNESGKTTILHAIFAFDWLNDNLNDDGRHLRDTANLYTTSSPPPRVTAELELTENDILDALSEAVGDGGAADVAAKYRRKRKHFPSALTITRDVTARRYELDEALFPDAGFNHHLARAMVALSPYILFFDDFRDSIDEKIEIVGDGSSPPSGWLAIIEQLFRRTDKQLSVFSLAKLEERRRKSVLAKVKKRLNETLTKEWQNFRLDDSDALEISLDYSRDDSTPTQPRHFLKLEIIETDANGDEHYFFVRDRSKGFFWFFNFVMKLEFNPKVIADDDHNTIYLLDEPGSYLHALAQTKLCAKLRQLSGENRVIYCTHSHYLLDPEHIPLASIKVADKDANGSVTLIPIYEHKGNISERRSAFQPVWDALHIKPFLLDLSAQRIILVEGIYDFYALEMFKQGRAVSAMPSVGASSIQYFVSLLIAWRVQFCVLWDNDDAGRASKASAVGTFGSEIADDRFYLLPLLGARRKRRLEDLFEDGDILMFKAKMSLPANASFEKVIASLYYWPMRTEILNAVSRNTRNNFEEVFNLFKID
ncbi:MAG TPA: hypothetical protein VNM92_02780 [Thermoanaerobaculia bacterium]|nr:hypothetical protein [Thermoanaerobaculia bacterium]